MYTCDIAPVVSYQWIKLVLAVCLVRSVSGARGDLSPEGIGVRAAVRCPSTRSRLAWAKTRVYPARESSTGGYSRAPRRRNSRGVGSTCHPRHLGAKQLATTREGGPRAAVVRSSLRCGRHTEAAAGRSSPDLRLESGRPKTTRYLSSGPRASQSPFRVEASR